MTRLAHPAYHGFEQGPIRPPSEADSLLIRVTRNCPWNRCTFCPVYKREKFSIRPVEHVKRDIDAVWRHVEILRESEPAETARVAAGLAADDRPAFLAAFHWLNSSPPRSVFLQDANSLAVKPDHLLQILRHLRSRFPEIERVTSYARSASLARLSTGRLAELLAAGLNRIHVGLESGSDAILARVQKGATQKLHIAAGRRVKEAGIELSEYWMPGLGGRDLSEVNARQSAHALNRIDPDFIRLRTLALPAGLPLHDAFTAGEFTPCTDREVAAEILLFLENLNGIGSRVRSDHILNLFQEISGRLPDDKVRMTESVRAFLDLPPQEQMLYQVGRRLGLFTRLEDLVHPGRRARAESRVRELEITADNVDAVVAHLMGRFV